MKIVVLCSTYNGEKYLIDQIDSILSQELSADAELKIYVRDDGSKDRTTNILEGYQSSGKLKWYSGNNIGPGRSFWDLIQTAEDADYYAFCDQDDVWCQRKILHAIEQLEHISNQNECPCLYTGNVIITDEFLKPIGGAVAQFHYTDCAHTLIYPSSPGCTYVFNRVARQILKKYKMTAENEIIHDWLSQAIVSIFGKVIYDEEPYMFYRQHADNMIGAIEKGPLIKKSLTRLKRGICSKATKNRSKMASFLLDSYLDIPSDKREILQTVSGYERSIRSHFKFMNDDKFLTNTTADIYFYLLIITNRL